MIGTARPHVPIKFFFRSTLQSLPLLERGMPVACNGCQHFRAVRKKKRIAHIKKNNPPFCHGFILSKGLGKQTAVGDLREGFLAVTQAGEKR